MQHVIAPDDRFLVAVGRHVAKGEEVEVPDEVAASLVEQGWESLRSRSAREAARRRARQTDAPTVPEAEAAAPDEADVPVTDEAGTPADTEE